jgi:hypothetical protein
MCSRISKAPSLEPGFKEHGGRPLPSFSSGDAEPRDLKLSIDQVDISRVRILFAGDLNRDWQLDFLLEIAWPNGDRRHELVVSGVNAMFIDPR